MPKGGGRDGGGERMGEEVPAVFEILSPLYRFYFILPVLSLSLKANSRVKTNWFLLSGISSKN